MTRHKLLNAPVAGLDCRIVALHLTIAAGALGSWNIAKMDGDVSQVDFRHASMHARDVQTLVAVLQQHDSEAIAVPACVIFLIWPSLGAQVNVDPGVLPLQSLHNATPNGRPGHCRQAVGRSYGRRLDRGLRACDLGPAIHFFFLFSCHCWALDTSQGEIHIVERTAIPQGAALSLQGLGLVVLI